ncbi:hypothetical protein BGX23_004442 [Mortierella sp. AD031]|nr:hypothetical protein BGX23_004442 [Mortierella sp. AD031]
MLRRIVFAFIATVQLAALVAHAHVDLSNPCARYTFAPGCPSPPSGQQYDYNVNAPISSNGVNTEPLCKYSVPYSTRTTYKAGEPIQTGYIIGSSHGGGHCQWALSYDREKTWVVIQTEIRTCLQGTTTGQANYSIPVTIPKDAPSGDVTFMWLWVNAIGDRELYSNCGDIRIDGSNGGTITGVEPLLANFNTSMGIIPEFPNPTDPDSHELFDQRKPITITVEASGAPSGPTSSGPTSSGPTSSGPTSSGPSSSSKPTPNNNENAAVGSSNSLHLSVFFIAASLVAVATI